MGAFDDSQQAAMRRLSSALRAFYDRGRELKEAKASYRAALAEVEEAERHLDWINEGPR